MLFFFCSNFAKNMLFALHYANFFKLLLKYALHPKYMSLNTAGQNKRLFSRNPHIGVTRSNTDVVGAGQDRSLK